MLRENIWQCELTGSPFVLGLFHPRIYLPYQISASDMDNVIAHEQAHIRRKDHWWKPVGFLLLSIHWFNPVIWIAYVLLCRDIEAACDEKVINHMSKDEMRAYSAALLNCSVHRRRIAACPLAFGEIGVKERINRVMNYRKPAFWIIVLVVILCAVVAVCFLTTPSKQLGLCNLRYDEMNMPDIMADVSTLDVTYDGVSVVCADEAEINRFLATLDKIQVNSKPISGNRSEDRSKVFSIKVNGNSELNFNESFTEFWVDDHVKPSRTHRITNPETAKELLSDYNLMISSANKGDTPPDPPIATDSDTVAESGTKKVPMVAFPAGTALTAYMPYVHWLTVDLNSGYLVPFEVTKN